MSYREHGMGEMLEILGRANCGEHQRAIVRTTIRRYLKVARELGCQAGQLAPDEQSATQLLDYVLDRRRWVQASR